MGGVWGVLTADVYGNNLVRSVPAIHGLFSLPSPSWVLSVQEGFYGWRNQDNQLITNIALPTYLNCSRDGRLSGCLFRFDKPDRQCTNMRKGKGE